MKEITLNEKKLLPSMLKISEPKCNLMQELIKKNTNDKLYTKMLMDKIELISNFQYSKLQELEKEKEQQIIHGDFYLDNLIINKNKIKAIDYEQTGLFYKEYEVIRALFMICYNPKFDDNKNLENMKKFIEGYKKFDKNIDLQFGIELFSYSSANSLYCYDDWNKSTDSIKEYAKYRYEMLKWILINKKEILKS